MKKAISRNTQSCISYSDEEKESRLMFSHEHEYKFSKYAFLFKNNTKDTCENEFTQFQ